MSSNWIEGKVVLITGAASGIGAATAVRLKARGARLALVDLNGEALQRTAAAMGPDVLRARGHLAVTASLASFVNICASASATYGV